MRKVKKKTLDKAPQKRPVFKTHELNKKTIRITS